MVTGQLPLPYTPPLLLAGHDRTGQAIPRGAPNFIARAAAAPHKQPADELATAPALPDITTSDGRTTVATHMGIRPLACINTPVYQRAAPFPDRPRPPGVSALRSHAASAGRLQAHRPRPSGTIRSTRPRPSSPLQLPPLPPFSRTARQHHNSTRRRPSSSAPPRAPSCQAPSP
jgi:hypothetical protein